MLIRNRQLNGLNASIKLNNADITVRNRYNPNSNLKTNSNMITRTIPLDNVTRVQYRRSSPTSAELVITSRDRRDSPLRSDTIKVDQRQMHHFKKLQQTINRQIRQPSTQQDSGVPRLMYRGFSV